MCANARLKQKQRAPNIISYRKSYSRLNISMSHFVEFRENMPMMMPQKLGERNQCDLSSELDI